MTNNLGMDEKLVTDFEAKSIYIQIYISLAETAFQTSMYFKRLRLATLRFEGYFRFEVHNVFNPEYMGN